jgi:hypothetical protein
MSRGAARPSGTNRVALTEWQGVSDAEGVTLTEVARASRPWLSGRRDACPAGWRARVIRDIPGIRNTANLVGNGLRAVLPGRGSARNAAEGVPYSLQLPESLEYSVMAA